MSDPLFPSGQWVGFYTYGKNSQRHLMDLILEFKNGIISGEGADGIGLFIISGRYDSGERECFWTKTYVRGHSVAYTGFRETKGIWGTWEIGHWSRGGFHIWPIGDGAPLYEQKEHEPVKADPVPAAPEPVPAVLLPPSRLLVSHRRMLAGGTPGPHFRKNPVNGRPPGPGLR